MGDAMRGYRRFIVTGLTSVALLGALAAPSHAQSRDDVLHLMGASMALTTFCPDLRYSDDALEALEVIYAIDLSRQADADAIRAARARVGAALEAGRNAKTLCAHVRVWYGPVWRRSAGSYD